MLSSPSASSSADILRPGIEAVVAEDEVVAERVEVKG
jgi:hypothetical protein